MIHLRAAFLLALTFLPCYSPAWGQAIEERTLVPVDLASLPSALGAKEIPVPFPIPTADVLVTAPYRSVAVLEGNVLPTSGIAVQAVSPNLSRAGAPAPGGPPAQPSRKIFHVIVQAAVQLNGGTLPLSQRPDGSFRGKAIIVGGVHAREWAAVEGVIKRLEAFHPSTTLVTRTFEDDLRETRLGEKPGSRDVFFAENLRMVFVPILNPGAYKTTQDHRDRCHIFLNNDTTNTPPLFNAGELRDGRLRRKNLLATDGVFIEPASQDTFALFGVDLNRNMTSTSNGSTASISISFAGNVADPEPETSDLKSLIRLEFVTGGPVLGGAALLDVHTPFGNVSFSGWRAMGDPNRPGGEPAAPAEAIEYADIVSNAVYGVPADGHQQLINRFTTTFRGTTDDAALNEFGVPGAALELPPDPAIASMITANPSPPNPGQLFRIGGRDFANTSTGEDLKVLVGPGGNPGQFDDQTRLAAQGIDAALMWAAGPPYVREVIVVQDKNGNGKFEIPEGAGEVLHFRRWVKSSTLSRASSELAPIEDPVNTERWLNNVLPEAKVALVFSKPMDSTTPDVTQVDLADKKDNSVIDLRTKTAGGISDAGGSGWQGKQLYEEAPGVSITPKPPQAPPGDPGGFGAKRYENDTWVGTFKLADAFPKGVTARRSLRLRVRGKDEIGLELDSNPATVTKWDVAERKYLNRDGGPDETHTGFLLVDTVPPRLTKHP